MHRKKSLIFELNTRWQVLEFWLKFWWRRLNLKWPGNKSLNFERNQNNLHFLANMDCHESDSRIKTISFSETSSKKESFWYRPWNAKSYLYKLGILSLKIETNQKLKNFFHFFVYRDYIRILKIILFEPNNPPQCSSFRLRFWCKKSSLKLWEESVWISIIIIENSVFMNIWLSRC